MAKTFDEYQRLKSTGGTLPLEEKLNAAMDQTELIQGVCARVTAFVKAYELDTLPEALAVENMRENGHESRAAALSQDIQTLKSSMGTEGRVRLLLDDLKILLDLMAEGYKP